MMSSFFHIPWEPTTQAQDHGGVRELRRLHRHPHGARSGAKLWEGVACLGDQEKSVTLWQTNSLLLKMAIELVDLPQL